MKMSALRNLLKEETIGEVTIAAAGGHPRKKQRVDGKAQTCKRVHFGGASIWAVDRIADIDVPFVWWSDEELRGNRRCDLQWFDPGDSRYREQLFEGLAISLGRVYPSDVVCLALAEHPLRGLERGLVPCFRERKKIILVKTLEAQSVVNTLAEDRKQHEKHLLALHYSKLALPSCLFAQLLARGDAMVASRLNA